MESDITTMDFSQYKLDRILLFLVFLIVFSILSVLVARGIEIPKELLTVVTSLVAGIVGMSTSIKGDN